jgi:hypothetical protein
MRHEPFSKTGTYEILELADFQPERTQAGEPFRSAAAAPDVPAVVGKMLVAVYVTLLATFAVTMARSREAIFAIAICAVFLTMYLGVPRILLGVEPKQTRRPSLDMFLYKGLETYTGYCSGKEALVQMLIVPILLTLCALAMGFVALMAV